MAGRIVLPPVHESPRIENTFRKDMFRILAATRLKLLDISKLGTASIRPASKALSKPTNQEVGLIRRIAASLVDSSLKVNSRRFDASIKVGAAVDLESIFAGDTLVGEAARKALENNVKLITSLRGDFVQDTVNLIEDIIIAGRPGSLTEAIQDRFGVSQSRAKLIARDQTAKVNASLTRARHEDLGIVEYVWLTVNDRRVRDSHIANNNKTFRYDTPPEETGNPGDDVNCRCIAKGVIPT